MKRGLENSGTEMNAAMGEDIHSITGGLASFVGTMMTIITHQERVIPSRAVLTVVKDEEAAD